MPPCGTLLILQSVTTASAYGAVRVVPPNPRFYLCRTNQLFLRTARQKARPLSVNNRRQNGHCPWYVNRDSNPDTSGYKPDALTIGAIDADAGTDKALHETERRHTQRSLLPRTQQSSTGCKGGSRTRCLVVMSHARCRFSTLRYAAAKINKNPPLERPARRDLHPLKQGIELPA